VYERATAKALLELVAHEAGPVGARCARVEPFESGGLARVGARDGPVRLRACAPPPRNSRHGGVIGGLSPATSVRKGGCFERGGEIRATALGAPAVAKPMIRRRNASGQPDSGPSPAIRANRRARAGTPPFSESS